MGYFLYDDGTWDRCGVCGVLHKKDGMYQVAPAWRCKSIDWCAQATRFRQQVEEEFAELQRAQEDQIDDTLTRIRSLRLAKDAQRKREERARKPKKPKKPKAPPKPRNAAKQKKVFSAWYAKNKAKLAAKRKLARKKVQWSELPEQPWE